MGWLVPIYSDMSSSSLRRAPLALFVVLLLAADFAVARPQGVPPDYGFDWATVTHAGNRAANATEAPRLFSGPNQYVRGSVDYEYRITKTEVTTGQYVEFINAWAPYLDNASGSLRVGSRFLTFTTTPRPDGGFDTNYSTIPGFENVPVDPSLRYAMLMSNWLHNGKQSDRESFLNGAYDLHNIPTNSAGVWTSVPSRQIGAKFWVPSIDEWTKAAYYDPNRNGLGQGGYWAYPNGSDSQPTPGLPGIGQTDAGLIPGPGGAEIFSVGSYPSTQSFWGLLDLMGGVSEWTETQRDAGDAWFLGAARYGGIGSPPLEPIAGRIDQLTGGRTAYSDSFGFRLASIPVPGSWACIAAAYPLTCRRRRYSCDDSRSCLF